MTGGTCVPIPNPGMGIDTRCPRHRTLNLGMDCGGHGRRFID
jgi:hypothetical protein